MADQQARCPEDPQRPLLEPAFYAPESVTRGRVRASRMGKRRATVLILVHVAAFAHILWWKLAGETLSPLEPSEAMYTVFDGAVNAGAILMLLSLLSVVLLGRFFCGWACHLVALQDLCGWIMKKCGIRPRPLRSRVLMLVPVGAGLFMFGMPLVVRIVNEVGPPEFHLAITKTDFWETFPGPIVGAITFVVTGFAMVYLLGAKGFCTYACPYGGLFGIADRLAPGRIRVTDACEGCGHCTATCTSNVQVAAEVARFKAVVDPGCMKCLDCITVCPKEALYFGFGRPPVSKRGLYVFVALFLGGFAAGLVLTGAGVIGGAMVSTALLIGGITAVALCIGRALVLDLRARARGTQKKQAYLARGEEIAAAVLFVFTLTVFVGLPEAFLPWADSFYGQTPLLLSLGLAGATPFLLIWLYRLVRRPDVELLGRPLKRAGRIQGAGIAFGAVASAWAIFLLHSAFLQGFVFHADRHFHEVDVSALAWRPDRDEPLGPETRRHLDAARGSFETARSLALWADLRLPSRLAGLALVDGKPDLAVSLLEEAAAIDETFTPALVDLGDVQLGLGRADDAERSFQRVVDLEPDEARGWLRLGQAQLAQRRNDQAEASFRRAVENAPADGDARNHLLTVLRQKGDLEDSLGVLADYLEQVPDDVTARLGYGSLFLELNRIDEGLEQFRAVIAENPRNATAHFNVGAALLLLRRDAVGALPSLERALELIPGDPGIVLRLGQCLVALERYEDALPHLETIVADYPEAGADPVALLLRCYEAMGREADAASTRRKLAEMRGGR